ncbi:MAG: hypothetical protein ACE5DM_02710 [Candidatus Nanoarchaeia archaeon]
MNWKKASLSLSINAIVVLVLAITMLGLGLGFTKGMFSKFSSKLTVPEPDIPATADDRVVLPADTISVPKNKQAIFSVNVYNDDWESDTAIGGSLSCGAGGEGPSAEAMAQMIPVGTDIGFKFILDKDQTSGTKAGLWVCSLTFGSTTASPVSKQIVINVK